METELEYAIRVISILFVIIFVSISILRIILTIILLRLIAKYKAILKFIKSKIDAENEKNKKSNSSNIEGEKARDKEKEKKKQIEAQKVLKLDKNGNVIGKYNAQYEMILAEKQKEVEKPDKTKIVGVVKPIGKWTELILGQKVSYLMQQAQQLKEQGDNGYWVNMMNAHDQRKGKGQGR